MRFPIAAAAILAAAAATPATRGAEAPAKAGDEVEAIAAKLPPDVAAAARSWLHPDHKETKALAAFSPQELEREVVVALASQPAAADFVLGRLAKEPTRTDIQILRVIAFDEFWTSVPGARDRIKATAEAAPDAELAEACLDTLRVLEVKEIRAILATKADAARKAGDTKSEEGLAALDERWLQVQRAATVPGFLRRPPALFQVEPESKAIRVVGMGDFGQGNDAQREVAAAIVRMGRATPFDFGLTFGDNFYPSGMTSPDEPRWRDWWEALYGPLGVTFYPTLGNHEWYSDDGAVSELLYRSASWRFPSPYYTFTAGPVQFFAVETTEVTDAELLWLNRELSASRARWRVVYGHHPIFAPEVSAKAGAYMKNMQARLWPVIRGRVDAYLCGHQHAMAHMEPREGVHFFMSGGGGAPLGKVAKASPGALFAESKFGFLTLEADPAALKISIFDTNGNAFDSEVITK